MKKNIISFFVIAIAMTSCSSDDGQSNSIDDQNNPITETPKKLKSIISNNSVLSYEYGANNYIKTESSNYGNGGIVGEIEYVYNNQDQIIEMNLKSKNRNNDTYKDFENNAIFTYTNELITSSVREYGYIGEMYTTVETTYHYNSDEKVIREEEKTTNNFDVTYLHTFYHYEADLLSYIERKVWENGSYASNFERIDYEFDTKINPEYYLYPKSYSNILSPHINANNLLSLISDRNRNVNYTATIDYNNDETPEKITKNFFERGSISENIYEYMD